jgi:hypothetical protein
VRRWREVGARRGCDEKEGKEGREEGKDDVREEEKQHGWGWALLGENARRTTMQWLWID